MSPSLKTTISVLFLFVLLGVARGSDLAPVSTAEDIAMMKSADSAWIFTVDTIGSRGPAQELGKTARRQLVAFISDPDNFGRPLAMPILKPDVGVEFRKNDRNLTIYTTWEFRYFYDNFPGAVGLQTNFLAVLDGKRLVSAQAWQKKYFPRPISSLHPAPGY